MGMYKAVVDELSSSEESSRCFNEKPFKDENLDSLYFVETQQNVEEQSPGTTMEYSIENGLKDPNLRREEVQPGWYSKIRAIPIRYYIVIGLSVLIGVILIVSISVAASKNDKSKLSAAATASTLQNNDVSSQIENPTDNTVRSEIYSSGSRFDGTGRGEGGGAGNINFVQSNQNKMFVNEDVQFSPFSTLDPVKDLNRFDFDRPMSSSPSARLDPLIDPEMKALPTNSWYQNMLRLDLDEEPTKDHRVYSVPYIIDAAGDFAGIRAHAIRLDATPLQVGILIDEPYGLTLGAMADLDLDFAATELDKGYSVQAATDLGLSLQWDSFMKTTLVRGSPYVTMIYDMSDQAVSEGMLPTMHWKLDTSELPIVDGNKTVDCESEPVFTVERDIELAFYNSNQRWMLFFSRSVQVRCEDIRGRPTILQVVRGENDNDDPYLIIRGALIVSSSNTSDDDRDFQERYGNQLRASADVYPGQSTSVTHSFNQQIDAARISFDWDAQSMVSSSSYVDDQMLSRNANEMIMFALPHHQEILAGKVSSTLCTTSLLGPVCLVEGNVWNMFENLPVVDFQAARHPDPQYVPILAQALLDDIRYQIPSNFQSGAADTYFSGKTIAKLARILLVAEEVAILCGSAPLGVIGESNDAYAEACDGLELPTDDEFEEALSQLRESVTVWVRTNSKAPFVYDSAWGGLVNCGCLYDNGECTNVFPNCPAFTDQGLNFGNGFYNDHHFHYGYHVYAAAALAHFDSNWAVEHYEDVALLVRDYANPSQEDTAFPVFRNKDWYRGHSWASGLTSPMFRNVMNQESSSEAIMAYEAVALFGMTMSSIFEDTGDTEKASVAKMMHKIGLTLTATEIRSTQKYWQVRQNVEDSEKIYPEIYTASVVGIVWETFVQFTTWFGNAPYLIYGIQLLPITPISEARDGLEWANEIYGPLADSCNGACISEGWSIQLNAILATIGRVQEAIDGILGVPSSAYEHAGGNGHSKTNSLWYIATRPSPNTPPAQSEEDFGTTTTVEEADEIETRDEDESEIISSGEGEKSITSGDDEEEFEIISGDEEGSTSIGGNEEDFEAIEIDEEDSNATREFEPEPEITLSDDDLRIDFSEIGFDRFPEDLNVGNENNSVSNDNNIFNNITAGNKNEGSYNNNDVNGDETIVVESSCFNSIDCTDEVLDTDADGYSCLDRIQYLMTVLNKSEFDACWQIAVDEYPIECGLCRPS